MLTVRMRKLLYIHNPPKVVERFVRSELTFSNPEYRNYVKLFKKHPYHLEPQLRFYQKSHNAIITPRGLWSKLRKLLVKQHIPYRLEDKRSENFWDEEITSNIVVRKYQEHNVKLAIAQEQATIIIPAGGGKTEVSLEIISRLRQNTIILVHTTELLKQWVARIKARLGYDAGIIQASKFQVKPITVASVMTLVRRQLDSSFYQYFGCIIVEEAHHCPASTFEKVVQHFPARYRFGITADAKRSDRMEGLLFAVCGAPIHLVDTQDLMAEGYIMQPTIIPVESPLRIHEDMLGEWHYITKRITRSKHRNNIIIGLLLKELEDNKKILLLSERKEHIRILYRRLRATQARDRVGVAVAGSMSKKLTGKSLSQNIEEFKSPGARILLASQLADEGVDIPSLDRVILSFPGKSRTKVLQRIGRVQRMFPGKEEAIVYDIFDLHVKTLMSQYMKRREVYVGLGFKIGQTLKIQL